MSLRQAAASSTKQLKLENLATLQSCRLCIICAKTTEAAIVKEQLEPGQTIPGRLVEGIPAGHDFDLGVIKTKAGELPYYITAVSRQGIQSFAVEAAVLFSVLKPEHAIHTGVCAALGGDANIRLKDVIYGEKALNYEEGKWADIDGEVTFLPDTKVLDTKSAAMDGYVEGLKRKGHKYGDYISGCALRMDAQHIMHRVRNTVLRDVKALDMEASAFLQVCNHMNIHAFGIIKGVSDKGDASRSEDKDEVYLQAMTNAANAVKEYLKWKLAHDPPGPADLDRQLGTQYVGNYFENFVKVAATKASDLGLKVSVGKETVVIKGFKVVLPQDYNASKYKSLRFYQQSWNLKEVSLLGGNRTTPLFCKGAYFVDFPTILTKLADLQDMATQVGYFKTGLEKAVEEININPRRFWTEVYTWDQFQKFCKDIEDEEEKEGEIAAATGRLTVAREDVRSEGSERMVTPGTSVVGEASGAIEEWVKTQA